MKKIQIIYVLDKKTT